jgi:hypothetical protein
MSKKRCHLASSCCSAITLLLLRLLLYCGCCCTAAVTAAALLLLLYCRILQVLQHHGRSTIEMRAFGTHKLHENTHIALQRHSKTTDSHKKNLDCGYDLLGDGGGRPAATYHTGHTGDRTEKLGAIKVLRSSKK